MDAYAELAVTTNFSFLRGASHADELVTRAKELGLTALGIADRNTVAGVVRAHTAAKEIGVKFVVGARLVFADRTPDILAYPHDRAAWGRLTRLLTVGKSRADKGECTLFLDDLLEYGGGLNLIVLPPEDIDADALRALLGRLQDASAAWLGASMLYRGDDQRRLAQLKRTAADAADTTHEPRLFCPKVHMKLKSRLGGRVRHDRQITTLSSAAGCFYDAA